MFCFIFAKIDENSQHYVFANKFIFAKILAMAMQNNGRGRIGLGTGLTGILSLQAPGTCKMISFFMLDVIVQDFSIDLQAHSITNTQWWAKGPIDRSSETDLIFRLYRPIKSVDFKF
jgi:hypothetical protein